MHLGCSSFSQGFVRFDVYIYVYIMIADMFARVIKYVDIFDPWGDDAIVTWEFHKLCGFDMFCVLFHLCKCIGVCEIPGDHLISRFSMS